MKVGTRVISTLAILAGVVTAQNGNNSPLNNGGDVIFLYSSPVSIGGPALGPADPLGDLYWRAHNGANFMCDTFGPLPGTQTMEIDGYYESLFDTDWTTSPSFYLRGHHPLAAGGLPDLLAGTSQFVAIGASGFGNPCTVAPSLCSPSGGVCPPPGFVNGYITDITFGATAGSGIVLPSDGTAASDTATVWYVTGGMPAVGGLCGLGDYDLQDVHSTNETQADPGTGLNASGGFQIAGGGLVNEAVSSMAEGHEQWRGNIVNVVAASAGGPVEVGSLLGGAMNGRRLPVGAGGATLGVELRDFAGAAAGPNIGIVGASLTALGGPGFHIPPPLGDAWLKVLPDGLFNSTSALWQGAVVPLNPIGFTLEGAFGSVQLPVPVTAVGATLHIQGATFSLPAGPIDSTNVVSTVLAP
jgi:hypothetical protein